MEGRESSGKKRWRRSGGKWKVLIRVRPDQENQPLAQALAKAELAPALREAKWF